MGICVLDPHGHCRGCARRGDEIGAWLQMDDAMREHLMEAVLPGRMIAPGSLAARLSDPARLLRALEPLSSAPAGQGWNHSELADILPPTPPVEAAVLVGLIPRPQGVQLLLTRRTEHLRHHGGQVGLPGGRIEPTDRNPVMAAIRECEEEIALARRQVQVLGYLDPFLTITGFRVSPVVAVIDPAFVAEADPSEVAEVFEVPFDFLMDPANLRQVPMEYRGRMRHVLEYTWPGQRIWGATAAILYNLRRRLEQVP
ncbi:CoA pyrophosphatase [Stenotrophomonas pictorum]|uniref:CoA pyrophosphatase n=1 Tax=Stenotrophomonas pictorum TaxID=86184 RepID=UPI003CCE298B